MGVYILGGLITLVVLLIVFLGNWKKIERKFGKVPAVALSILAFTLGLVAWPLTLALLALNFVLSKTLTVEA